MVQDQWGIIELTLRRVSELRFVELLDGMCNSMTEYELAPTASGLNNGTVWLWLKPKKGKGNNPKSQKLDKQQLKRQQKQLQNYCASLIDRFEDDISAALQQGSNAQGKLMLLFGRAEGRAHCTFA